MRDQLDHYIIRGGVEGRERLRVLARAMAPATSALLGRIGIDAGSRCLGAGGGGDVTLELARLTGTTGHVVGIDIDDLKLKIAREEAAAAGLGNVEYRQTDIDELGSDDRTFDVIYARFVLSHLSAPQSALETLARATRSGGIVAFLGTRKDAVSLRCAMRRASS